MNVQDVAFRIIRTAGPIRHARGENRPIRSVGLTDDDRREERTDLELRDHLQRFRTKLGCEINKVIRRGNRSAPVSRRLGRNRLCGGVPLAWDLAFWHRTFLDWPDRLASYAIEGIQESLLRRLGKSFDGAAVACDIDQHRSARNVEIPDAMVDQLIVPLPLAGLQVHRDDAFAKQPIAGPVPSILITGG